MRLGTQTGSGMNHFMTTARQLEPVVGMGATVCCWTDRHAGTIVKVTPCQIHLQYDTATRTDDNGMSESQSYDYEPNPNAPVVVFRKTKQGWKSQGKGLLIGFRQHYHDYSF